MDRNMSLLLIAALLTASVVATGARAYAGSGGTGTFSYEAALDQAPNDIVPYPGQRTDRDFTIGLKGPNGYCDTLKVSAASEVDALYYAHHYCPACNLQDLTGEHVRGEAPWESMTPLSQEFCTK